MEKVLEMQCIKKNNSNPEVVLCKFEQFIPLGSTTLRLHGLLLKGLFSKLGKSSSPEFYMQTWVSMPAGLSLQNTKQNLSPMQSLCYPCTMRTCTIVQNFYDRRTTPAQNRTRLNFQYFGLSVTLSKSLKFEQFCFLNLRLQDKISRE